MSKAVMLSIQPKWCELIASGKKTVEVRKTRPKIETPFKCYIYCTNKETALKTINNSVVLNSGYKQGENLYGLYEVINGKVIGEFVCDCITSLYNVCYDEWERLLGGLHRIEKELVRQACLTEKELHKYASGKNCYAWHISDLVIYDKPKELSEFYTVNNEAVQKCKNRVQSYFDGYCNSGCLKCGFYCCEKDDWCDKCKTKPITRPPQSWCYVEEV